MRQAALKLTGFIAFFILLFCPIAFAKTAAEIDASVDHAMNRFQLEVTGANALISKTKAILVFPTVIQGGFVVGAEYGVGALRVNGKTVDYYNTITGSLGFQLGGQAKSVYIFFMDDLALKGFESSEGWEAGVDGAVTLIAIGAEGSIDTTKTNEPIIGFVMNQKGLMYNLTLEGSKYNKIVPDKI